MAVDARRPTADTAHIASGFRGIRELGASIGFMAKTSRGSDDDDATLPEPDFPQWFSAFLADRAVRKPSPHTAKAYRQDFAAIANSWLPIARGSTN